MTSQQFDVVVIGAGIAGASAAWALAEHASVALVEQAAAPGHHATGRSASVLSETSGHRVACALAAASRRFFESPPQGFAEHPLLSPRGLLWVGEIGDSSTLDELAINGAAISSTVKRLTAEQTKSLVPHFRPRAIAGGSTFEPDAMSIDTDALLHGFLRGLRERGGQLFTANEAISLNRIAGAAADRQWSVTCGARTFTATTVVNAAGAWGDVIAQRAGVATIGLEPRRRTACIAALAGTDPRWPLVMDAAGRYYAEPEAGGLLISPADESPSDPCDAQAEELDVALALDRLQRATTLPLRSIRRSWAGLRTFSPDGAPVVGEEPSAPGFWWLVGQAGAGIKTAPAMAALLTALIRGTDIPASISTLISVDDVSPLRFGRPG